MSCVIRSRLSGVICWGLVPCWFFPWTSTHPALLVLCFCFFAWWGFLAHMQRGVGLRGQEGCLPPILFRFLGLPSTVRFPKSPSFLPPHVSRSCLHDHRTVRFRRPRLTRVCGICKSRKHGHAAASTEAQQSAVLGSIGSLQHMPGFEGTDDACFHNSGNIQKHRRTDIFNSCKGFRSTVIKPKFPCFEVLEGGVGTNKSRVLLRYRIQALVHSVRFEALDAVLI